MRPTGRRHATWSWTERCLAYLLLAALCFGVYGRFAGLGRWPFGVDEYYISHSIDNVLRSGLPGFPCGGYYTRGLSFQYLVAAVRLLGWSPELSARLVSALAGMIGLPAAYLIGRRLHGRILGLIMLIVLSASVWEIEMGRFARMYAPFQSLFLWYVVYFLEYAVDRRQAALLPMVLLSILGVLTWEGGALLGAANLLPPLLNHERGRLRRGDWMYLGGMLVLLAVLVAACTIDLRGLPPALPHTNLIVAPSDPPPLDLYLRHPGWMTLWCLLPVPLAIHSLPWIWSLRARWLGAAGLCVALLSALLHQFILCGAALALLLLADLIRLPELRQSAARSYVLALIVSAALWLAFGFATGAWADAPRVGTLSGRWLGLLEHLCGFPRVFGEILRPWVSAMPLLTCGMLLLSGTLAVQSIRRPPHESRVQRALLTASLLLMLAVGASEPDRIETRYTFFLYPLLMATSLAGLLSLAESAVARQRVALALGAAASLLFFGLTEDFQPRHVARIASWDVNFRVGMSPVLAAHYYPRGDYRLAAAWLDRNVRPGEAVMIAIPTIDQYYPRADFFYLPDGDDRYDDYACSTGTTERWTNLPLLYGSDTLATPVAAGRRIVLLMYPTDARAMLVTARRHDWRASLVWTSPDGGVSAVDINP